jgi:hypothetical protein
VKRYGIEKMQSYSTININALQNLADAELLPDDIRVLVERILALHKTASDPFFGMNLPEVGIDAADAEEQARQDWSNDE